VVWAGRHRRDAWDRLASDYRGRIARHASIRDAPVKAKRGGEDLARRQEEGRALLAALPDPCWAIALDPRGEALDSESFSRELTDLKTRWPHPIAFLIGSDLGLDPAVLERADRRLAFGPMTLGHELARLVLYEQIYRAISIERGIKYHRGLL